MGTFFGVLVGFVLGLVLAGAAFIDIVSTDDDKTRYKAALMIQTGDFREPERVIGLVYGEDAAGWHAHIFKTCCGAEYFADTGKLAGVVILRKEDEQ